MLSNGIIKDVLPAGLTYVDPASATHSYDLYPTDFNVTTPGTLTWKAATVSANGSLTYKVTVDADAADEAQPLKNTATIDSDDTAPSLGHAGRVAWPAPVEAPDLRPDRSPERHRQRAGEHDLGRAACC